MTQEFRGDTQGQFAGRDIINHNYAPEPNIPWRQQPDSVLKLMIKREKQKRFNAIKRKYINIPSIILLLVMMFSFFLLYTIVSPFFINADLAVITRLNPLSPENLVYLIIFLAVFTFAGLWFTSKARIETRIIKEANSNIDDIRTVLKSRH